MRGEDNEAKLDEKERKIERGKTIKKKKRKQ